MSPVLEAHFREYARYHRHPVNRLLHTIAIPAIVFHILAMLDWIHLVSGSAYHLSAGHLFFGAVIAWYLTLSARLALIAGAVFLPCFALALFTPAEAVVAIAILAWTLQLAGHWVWEKRSPAFLTNLLQALIGPLYFLAVLTGDAAEERPAAGAPPSSGLRAG